MIELFRKLWHYIKDCLFPKVCFGCQKEGEYLCSACFDKINYIDDQTCRICNVNETDNGICQTCHDKTGIDKIIVATRYSGEITGQLVEAFKYNFVEALKEILVKILLKKVNKDSLSGTVVPIPLHKKRLVERGFNQAAELARPFAKLYNLEYDDKLLMRKKHTDQQAKLTRTERLVNVDDAFLVRGRAPETVVLFDDVLTTGATFTQAAKALRAAGVNKIICMALCHG
jgi:competence protein ComFC